MLQSIRDRAQGIVIWLIVGLIILSFALWGVEGYFGGGGDSHVASVDGLEIGQNELTRAHQNRLEELQRMLGDNYRAGMLDENALRRQALDQLIDRYVLRKLLEEAGFAAAPQQVRATIQSMDAFHDQDGNFSLARYEQLLGYQGMSPEQFEREVGRDITTQQLYGGIVGTGFVTGVERERHQRLVNQTRDVGVLTVSAETFLPEITIEDEQVRTFYEDNRDRFMTPAQVEINYLELSLDNLAQGISISEDELRAYYEEHRQQYTSAEERRARHILIAVDPERDEEAAESQIEDLQKALREGAEFGQLAREHSDDPGSAAQGGDLGFFPRGVMDPAFEEAVFSLEEGEISEPVRSDFGYHLIKLEEIREPSGRSFEEVRDEIAHELRLQEAEPQFYEVLDRATNLTYEHPETLEVAAEDLELQVRQAGPFSRQGGEGVAANPQVVAEAFEDEVLQERINSDPVEIGPNHYVILRVREQHPAEPREFDAVADQIRERLRQQAAREKAAEAARKAAEQLRGGAAGAEIATGENDWNRVEALSRTPAEKAAPVPTSVRRLAFQLPYPGADAPSVDTVGLPSGDVAVVAVYGVAEGTVAEADEGQTEQLARALSESEFTQLMRFARQAAEVQINEDAL